MPRIARLLPALLVVALAAQPALARPKRRKPLQPAPAVAAEPAPAESAGPAKAEEAAAPAAAEPAAKPDVQVVEAVRPAEPKPVPAEPEPPAPAPPEPWRWNAELQEEYWFRASNRSESDHQLRFLVSAGATDPSRRFNAVAGLDLWWRFAETRPPSGRGLASPRDPFWLGVYQLAGEYADSGTLRLVRAGRQATEHGRPATFDGVYALARPEKRVNVYVLGGRTEHFFYTGPGLFENWLGALGAAGALRPDLRVEAEYRFLREARPQHATEAGTLQHATLNNNAYSLSAAWRRERTWLARAYLRGVDTHLTEAGVQGRWLHVKNGTGVDARLHLQPATLGELDEFDSAYFLTLGESRPHARWKLDVWQGYEHRTGIYRGQFGWSGRRVLSGEEGPFNRNIGRMYLTGSVVRPGGIKGLSANLSVERTSDYALPLLGQGLWALNGSVGYERGRLRASAGSQYHRYQYGLLFPSAAGAQTGYYQDLREIADTRVFYLDGRWKARDWMDVRARYTAEVSDRVLHYVTIGLAQAW